jgi:hypothetical protein
MLLVSAGHRCGHTCYQQHLRRHHHHQQQRPTQPWLQLLLRQCNSNVSIQRRMCHSQ